MGRVADLWASLYSAPLAGALLAAPFAWPRRGVERAVVAWTYVRGALPLLAAANVATLATGVALAAVGFGRLERDRRAALAHRAAGAFGAALALAAVLRLSGDESGLATTVVALAVAGCGSALLAGGRRRLSLGGVSRLIVDLGDLHDARSLERRLADALGDPRLELRYRLRSGGGWLDVAARTVPPPRPGDREVTTVAGGDGMAAALVHDPGTLDDPRLRDAVLQAVRLAVVRLGLAAEAAAQAEQLAASRRRLVSAATRERDRFAADVQAGPGALLAEAAAALDAAVRVAPPGLERCSQRRRPTSPAPGRHSPPRWAASFRSGSPRTASTAALVELARRAGATADVRVDTPVAPDVAAGAWYCASEALANALKHAGAARIALSARVDDGRIVLAVTDDGPGGADTSGGGLAGLRSRAAAVGGELTVDSPPGGGTRIAIRLPVN